MKKNMTFNINGKEYRARPILPCAFGSSARDILAHGYKGRLRGRRVRRVHRGDGRRGGQLLAGARRPGEGTKIITIERHFGKGAAASAPAGIYRCRSGLSAVFCSPGMILSA